MAESVIWKSKPSHLLNIGVYLSSFLIITLPLAIIRWKYLNEISYEVSSDNLSVRREFLDRGITSIKIRDIDNIYIEKPLFLRLFSLSNLIVSTIDHPNEKVVLSGIKEADKLKSKLLTVLKAA